MSDFTELCAHNIKVKHHSTSSLISIKRYNDYRHEGMPDDILLGYSEFEDLKELINKIDTNGMGLIE